MNPSTITSTPAAGFRCSICEEPSLQICAWCTKDACDNHICQKCRRCSDCCACELERGSQSPA